VPSGDPIQPHESQSEPSHHRRAPAEIPVPTPARPPRADARRNRARILDAAEVVLAARGISASTEEVARAAGVGIGTVFRHFPTKEALLEVVFVGRLQRLADDATALATAADPGAAFFTFFARVVEQAAVKQAFSDALASAGIDLQTVTSAVGTELKAAIGLLLARAQQAGAVRPDVRLPDVLALLVGASRALEHAAGDRDAQARALAVILDGLRPARL
jgi:AcrR family transcriptional regulator